MRKLIKSVGVVFTTIGLSMFTTFLSLAQTTTTFTYTGGPQTWTVPNCVTSISINCQGGQGGGPAGGLGAIVTGSIPVNPGDVITIVVGGQGGLGVGGYGGGGNAGLANSAPNGAFGGGGASSISVNGTVVMVAGAGGGVGGGDTDQAGGAGGCTTGGVPPGWAFGAPGGVGTQVSGGAGGGPWGGGASGQAGTFMQGGTGATDPCYNLGPGGGGGGGYYGGGGGGSDCWPSPTLGGGAGGGGSSLVPGGGGCTQGASSGTGEITISYTGGSATASIAPAAICEGSTTTVSLVGMVGAFNWESSTDGGVTWTAIAGATTTPYVTGPLLVNTCFRANEPGGGCAGTPYSNVVCATVSPKPTPNAGIDDSICFPTGYMLQGTSAGGTLAWTQYTGPGASAFAPSGTILTPTVTATLEGQYQYILSETDPTGLCPAGKDTVGIFFAKENHTTSFVDPTCNGYSDGSITITTSGNLGAVDYSFDGGSTYQASNTSGNTFSAGTYTVISRDALGCTYQSTVTLTDPALVVVSVSNDTTVCQNGTATVSASATGGTSYLYHWSQTASTTAVQTVSPTVPVTVTVFAENQVGCISTPLDIDITMHTPITLVITPNDTVCPGYPSSHTVTAAGGYMGYTYSWTANGAAMAGVTNVADVTPASQTAYCVTVGDGCETTPVNICTNTIMREVPNPIFTSDLIEGCSPTEIEFTNLTTLIAPATIDSVTWMIEGIMYHDQVPFTHNFINVGTYDIWLEVYTNFGCHNSVMVSDYITIHANPEAMFYANPNPTTIFNTEVDFTNLSTPGNNTYQWTFGGGNPSSSNSDGPTVNYPEGYAAKYPVQLIVINEFGCSDTITGEVDVQSDILIFVPNAFTPDGDEFNETWRVYIDGIDIYDFHLTVFNRWGEIVWESYNPEGAWNGTYGTTEAKTGTYVWQIEAKDKFSDKKVEWRGHVTVLK